MKITPAIVAGKKVYTGKDHGVAIRKAKAAGEKVKMADRWAIGKFVTPRGVLTRQQAKKAYGISRSEDLKKRPRL